MVKSSDLRIGNWVSNGEKNYTIDVNVLYDLASSEFNGGEFPIEPIPLTPEVLIACGFKMRDDKKIDDYYNNYWLPNNYAISLCVHGTEIHDEGCFYCGKTEVQVKYLHKLQNLYYELTDKELRIKDLNLAIKEKTDQ